MTVAHVEGSVLERTRDNVCVSFTFSWDGCRTVSLLTARTMFHLEITQTNHWMFLGKNEEIVVCRLLFLLCGTFIPLSAR